MSVTAAVCKTRKHVNSNDMKIFTHPVRLRYVNLKSKMANTKLCNYSKVGIMFP